GWVRIRPDRTGQDSTDVDIGFGLRFFDGSRAGGCGWLSRVSGWLPGSMGPVVVLSGVVGTGLCWSGGFQAG
ncbi:MAG: hypothetical protein J2P17_05705, partial [Mycobacterium sp.]|nr:hypothetical protein [Mycobacterium sp.]